MEKPLTADGPTSRKMFKLAEDAKAKNLKVGVGLMSRHSRADAGTGRTHSRRRNRRHHLDARLSHARAGRLDASPPKPAEHLRSWSIRFAAFTASCGPAAAASATSTSTHRRMLLDERRLARAGPGDRRPALSRQQRRPEFRHLLASNTSSPTAPGYHGRPLHGRLRRKSTPATRHGTKGTAIISHDGDIGTPSAIYKGSGLAGNLIWESKLPPTSATRIRTNGTTWSRPSAKTSRTTKSRAVSKPAW